jgi:hypothetical protein
MEPSIFFYITITDNVVIKLVPASDSSDPWIWYPSKRVKCNAVYEGTEEHGKGYKNRKKKIILRWQDEMLA